MLPLLAEQKAALPIDDSVAKLALFSIFCLSMSLLLLLLLLLALSLKRKMAAFHLVIAVEEDTLFCLNKR